MATVLTGIILGATTGSKKIINDTTEMDYVENSKYSVSQTFGKLGYFWLFLSAPVQAISVNNPQFFCSSWLLPALNCLKRAKFSKNVPNAP